MQVGEGRRAVGMCEWVCGREGEGNGVSAMAWPKPLRLSDQAGAAQSRSRHTASRQPGQP